MRAGYPVVGIDAAAVPFAAAPAPGALAARRFVTVERRFSRPQDGTPLGLVNAAPPMANTPHVLVADDTTLVRWAVHRALNDAGFTVAEAETRSQALEALVSGSFRLVILSLALGGDDMEDIARAIASSPRTTGLIVLTENDALPDALRAHTRVRAVDKPFSVTELVDVAMTLAPPAMVPEGESLL